MIYCHKLSLLITNRFDWLLGRMRTVQRGSFSVEQRAPLETQDEIGMVCQQFEDMVAALNKLIQDNYVKQIRRKLADGVKTGGRIETVHGVGYRYLP